VVCFALILFSLVGLPPLAGFVGKFAIFASLANAYLITDQPHLLALLIIGGLNTAVSLFYYLRVVKVMTMDPESERITAESDALVPLVQGTFVVLLTVPVALLIIKWNLLGQWSLHAARQLFL
jgi:NADH-quinone oxidoreductase subunit N